MAARWAALIIIFVISATSGRIYAAKPGVSLRVLGTYAAGAYNQGAAEIVAHDPATQRLFVVNGAQSKIDVLDTADPSNPTLMFSITLSAYGRQANSVDVKNGIVAVAVEAVIKTDAGKAVFFNTNGDFLNAVPAGALPDMITFTPDGQSVLVANEGEPNSYGQLGSVDPEGSVTIIDISAGVANAIATTAGFSAFNGTTLDPGIRIFGPGASVARDLEPEYITVSHDSKTAWVTLQENNAIAILDLKSGLFTDLIGLGFKDYRLAENKFDAGDRDGAGNTPSINIANWPVYGMYQPDGIASFKFRNDTFLITANEGDARDYTGLVEEIRVSSSSYPLDTVIFPNAAALKTTAQIGRLNVSKLIGNTDGGSDYEEIYTFGARSFSILTAAGERIYDSGDDIEQITAAAYPNNFNANHSCDPCSAVSTGNEPDNRSDNKGPEPEGVTVGKAYGRTYAFIGLERIGGVLVYDVSNPYDVKFVQYINNRNFLAIANTAAAKDLGPEGLHFISEDDSPTGVPLLAVANEVSGTTTIYELAKVR